MDIIFNAEHMPKMAKPAVFNNLTLNLNSAIIKKLLKGPTLERKQKKQSLMIIL